MKDLWRKELSILSAHLTYIQERITEIKTGPRERRALAFAELERCALTAQTAATALHAALDKGEAPRRRPCSCHSILCKHLRAELEIWRQQSADYLRGDTGGTQPGGGGPERLGDRFGGRF